MARKEEQSALTGRSGFEPPATSEPPVSRMSLLRPRAETYAYSSCWRCTPPRPDELLPGTARLVASTSGGTPS